MFGFINKLEVSKEKTVEFWAKDSEQDGYDDQFRCYRDVSELTTLMKAQSKGTRFVFHGLFEHRLWPFLAYSSLAGRCAWVCWGAEVYQFQKHAIPWKRKLAKFFLRLLLPRLLNVYGLNQGDADIITTMSSRKQIAVMPYPLIGSTSKAKEKAHGDTLNILLGNSASPNNSHSEALRWLAKFSDENVNISAPLNYAGSEEYIKEVTSLGKTLFGDKFTPITHMLDKTEYDHLLAQTDVAVFAHDRQQGLYVVYSILKHGRKMFLRSTISSSRGLKSSGFDIYDSESIADMCFDDFRQINENKGNKNSELMLNTFSEEALIPLWNKNLEELFE